MFAVRLFCKLPYKSWEKLLFIAIDSGVLKGSAASLIQVDLIPVSFPWAQLLDACFNFITNSK